MTNKKALHYLTPRNYRVLGDWLINNRLIVGSNYAIEVAAIATEQLKFLVKESNVRTACEATDVALRSRTSDKKRADKSRLADLEARVKLLEDVISK